MVHIIYDTSSPQYDAFFAQAGEGLPTDDSAYSVFRGSPPYQRGWGQQQRGAGVGDVLRGVWRFFLPVLKKIALHTAAETLNTGSRTWNKIREGQEPKEALITEGKCGMDNLLERGGFERQFGTGKRKRGIKRAAKPHPSLHSHQTIIGKTVAKPLAFSKKRLRSDAFGLY